MGFKGSSLLFVALMLAFSSAIHAFDITKLLSSNPEFSTFNNYLTETKLVDQINSRNTITVLAVANDALSSIAGKSPEVIKAIISTHVILDFFDEKRLMEAVGSGEQMTTLFQTSGLAVNNQGFIKVSLIGEGEFAFGSAVSGAPIDAAELMSTVHSEPYNISILQVTKPIIAPGVDSSSPGAKAPTAAQTAKAPVSSAKAPAAAVTAKAPVSSAKAPAAAVTAKAPVPAQSAKAPSQSAKAPVVSPPSPSSEGVAQTPQDAAEAPATSPIAAEGPAAGPIADDAAGPAADDAADVPANGSASSIKMGFVGAVMTFTSFFMAL